MRTLHPRRGPEAHGGSDTPECLGRCKLLRCFYRSLILALHRGDACAMLLRQCLAFRSTLPRATRGGPGPSRRRELPTLHDVQVVLCGCSTMLCPSCALKYIVLFREPGRVTETDEPLTPQGQVATRCPQLRGHSQPSFSLLPHPTSPLSSRGTFLPLNVLELKCTPSRPQPRMGTRT